jgi:hypothetical protein
MVTESQAEEYILDRDGSCRGVTSTPASKSAIIAFVNTPQ